MGAGKNGGERDKEESSVSLMSSCCSEAMYMHIDIHVHMNK